MTVTLADFGSTFTKVTIVEGDTGAVIGTAQHPTTIDSDVMDGFARARAEALAGRDGPDGDRSLAASSAGGGLRMAAVGLVDDLTAGAAERAALGAGAKVAAVWSGVLDERTAEEARELGPDVLLFAGGTDGGDRRRVLANARAVAGAAPDAAVVVACNAAVAGEVSAVFAAAGHETVVVDNVLPEVGREADGPARAAIREVFIRRVVRAKGMSEAAAFFEAVAMPSPAAVLACAELLADGTGTRPGCGSVVVVDVGGATTDVHSVLPAAPPGPEPARATPAPARSARTVEGDLGVRWNADTVLAQDEPWLARELGLDADALREAVAARTADPGFVPVDEPARDVDRALAVSCIASALRRHVGRMATHYVPGEGAEVRLDGRDLRDAPLLLVTGGSVVRDARGAESTVRRAISRLDETNPAPMAPTVLVDRRYVLAAAGLLADRDPEAAMRLLDEEVPGLCAVLPRP